MNIKCIYHIVPYTSIANPIPLIILHVSRNRQPCVLNRKMEQGPNTYLSYYHQHPVVFLSCTSLDPFLFSEMAIGRHLFTMRSYPVLLKTEHSGIKRQYYVTGGPVISSIGCLGYVSFFVSNGWLKLHAPTTFRYWDQGQYTVELCRAAVKRWWIIRHWLIYLIINHK